VRFTTFLVTGVEVLQLGGQRWESNAWSPAHWRLNKGRFRLFTVAIDEQVTRALARRTYGGNVEGIVVAPEIADFKKWPKGMFTANDAVPSFKPKRRDLWCYAKLDWKKIQSMTLRQQYSAYCEAVLAALNRVQVAKRKPRGFLADRLVNDLRSIFAELKVSTLTRSAHKRLVA
jgi:hypothetical protein